jgi:DNA-binding transcriptional MerR regulator
VPIATNATTAATSATSVPEDHHAEPDRFLRIQEVADEIGLTTRAIRYYEEQGLLQPVARSEGSYRLYDPDDLERLRFIKGLRDDAGFSLAEIRQLLEDEAARRAVSARYRTTDDPAERRRLLGESLGRAERQIEILRHKAERLAAMIDEATERRKHLEAHLAQLEGGPDPHGDRAARPAKDTRGPEAQR